eukprot:gene12593-16887_t
MNEWAARLLSVFPERTKADLDQFLFEVNQDEAEQMYITKEFNADIECRPTFEQISQERVLEEANKNIAVLKALESVISERMNGLTGLNAALHKTKTGFETFDACEGSLRIALDSLFVMVDWEINQSKQQIFLGDLKKSLSEMRADATRRVNDYQKELSNADKEVSNAEKRLAKSKETLEKYFDSRVKLESFELDGIISATRSQKSNHLHGNNSINPVKSDRLRDSEEMILRCEKEIREDITLLLRAIGVRDRTLSASRRAFQKLDKDCKKAIYFTLKKLVEKEKDNLMNHKNVVDKFDAALDKVDIDEDIRNFIDSRINRDKDKERDPSREGAVVYSEQALSLLGDLMPQLDITLPIHPITNANTPSRLKESNTTPSRSFSKDVKTSNKNNDNKNIPMKSPTFSLHNNFSDLNVSATALANGISDAMTLYQKRKQSRVISMNNNSSGKNNSKSSSPNQNEYVTFKSSLRSDVSSLEVVGSHTSIGVESPKPLQAWEFTQYLSQIFYFTFEEQSLLTSENQEKDEKLSEISNGISSSNNNNNDNNNINNNNNNNNNDNNNNNNNNNDNNNNNNNNNNNSSDSNDTNGIQTHSFDEEHKLEVIKGVIIPINTSYESVKEVRRKTKIMKDSGSLDFASLSTSIEWNNLKKFSPDVERAVDWICQAVRTQHGRDLFTAELNQFRSKKVDVGDGFDALAAVLWTTLNYCLHSNDIHNAKVIMMLSQTFYRKATFLTREKSCKTKTSKQTVNNNTIRNEGNLSDHSLSEDYYGDDVEIDEDDGIIGKRGADHRQYIKERLVNHPIWQDGNYWEQALWQCALEQLATIPYEKAWHNMDREGRNLSVRRVHDVIFSQVMAITHSMLELGCSKEQAREFLYRMCVIHQLNEAQRQLLLTHILHKM